MRKVDEVKSTAELWKKLEQLYLVKSLPNKIFLLEQFFGFKMDTTKDLDANIDDFNKLCLSHVEVLAVSLNNDKIDWILDSGCTYHMCPTKSWFHSYNKIDGGKVLLGNNMSCNVVGIGSVQVKLDDGTVKTLSSVRHVPELQRNLISLGMLDEAGYTCKTESGNMKISRGSYVAMRGVKKNGLYVLLGKTLTNSAAVANSSKSVIDQTRTHK